MPQRRRVESPRLALSALACVGLMLAPLVAGAAEAKLEVSGQWMRALPGHLPAAGYFTLFNRGNASAELTGASSTACRSLMLHRSEKIGGMERMVMVKSVVVPADGSAVFEPGGFHLMCTSPSPLVAPGKVVPVILHFAGGGVLSTAFPVRNASGK